MENTIDKVKQIVEGNTIYCQMIMRDMINGVNHQYRFLTVITAQSQEMFDLTLLLGQVADKRMTPFLALKIGDLDGFKSTLESKLGITLTFKKVL